MNRAPGNRTFVLKWSITGSASAYSRDDSLTRSELFREDQDVRQQIQEQLSEQQQQAVDDLRALKLPEFRGVAEELSSTKKNRLVLDAIGTSVKSLGTILGSLGERYAELGDSLPVQAKPAARPLIAIIGLANERVRRAVYEHLKNEFGPKSVDPVAVAATKIGKVERLADIDAARTAFLKEFVFGGLSPSTDGFLAWFERQRGREIETREEKRAIATAVSEFCREFDLELSWDGQPVSIGVPGGGGKRGEGTFWIEPKKGSKATKVSTGHVFPRKLALM